MCRNCKIYFLFKFLIFKSDEYLVFFGDINICLFRKVMRIKKN